MKLGDKILHLRKARGWSQEELADQIGVTRQAVSRWEYNSANPDADKIIDICDLFGISADYLLREKYDGEGEVQPQEDTAPTPAKPGISAIQVLGILLIISAILIIAVLGILNGFYPSYASINDVEYSGFYAYILVHDLEWLVAVDAAALVIGLLLMFSAPIKAVLSRFSGLLLMFSPSIRTVLSRFNRDA